MAEAAAATREEEREARMMNKSPSDFSYQSYEMFVGGQAAPPDGRSSVAGGGTVPGGGGPLPGCCSSSAAGGGGGECCCCCNAHNGNNSSNNRVDNEKISLQSDDADSLTGGSRVKINGCVNRKVQI